MNSSMTPTEWFEKRISEINTKQKYAFISAFLIGILTHLPAFVNDMPNHDGLASVYFDQNMITSGRWFLTVACGISSYFTLPWLIGIISLLWVSITCVILVELFEIKSPLHAIIISAIFVTFPALASTYAYIYTADGYMFAMFLAVLAVYLTKKYPSKGFIFGGICLAFSMGTYQAYLPVTMLLSLLVVLGYYLTENEKKDKTIFTAKIVGMGAIGVALYYIILQILLRVEGVSLADYQGINGMTSLTGDLFSIVKGMYMDFLAFIWKGNVICNNIPSAAALCLLALLSIIAFFSFAAYHSLFKNVFFYLFGIISVALVPIFTNIILIISPDVNYHLLMRYQYVLIIIAFFAGLMKRSEDFSMGSKLDRAGQWIIIAIGLVISLNYMVTDNIGYSNLEKRYEKTYAYCLRLADRIEQTPGYYTGMPVVMIGVVGDWNYPSTDLTGEVTSNMIGFPGDTVCYKPEDYKSFFANYLGITIEVMDQKTIGDIYLNDERYYELDSFPGEHCTEVVDGVLYVKTENALKITGEKPQ